MWEAEQAAHETGTQHKVVNDRSAVALQTEASQIAFICCLSVPVLFTQNTPHTHKVSDVEA